MKKNYITPAVDTILLASEDIMVLSGNGGTIGEDYTPGSNYLDIIGGN